MANAIALFAHSLKTKKEVWHSTKAHIHSCFSSTKTLKDLSWFKQENIQELIRMFLSDSCKNPERSFMIYTSKNR